MGQFIDESQHERTMRRVLSCMYTLHSIAEELDDPEDVELRGDMLIAAEHLLEATHDVVDLIRGIAWQHSLTPAELAAQEDNND